MVFFGCEMQRMFPGGSRFRVTADAQERVPPIGCGMTPAKGGKIVTR